VADLPEWAAQQPWPELLPPAAGLAPDSTDDRREAARD
jgi:hypothetical protein